MDSQHIDNPHSHSSFERSHDCGLLKSEHEKNPKGDLTGPVLDLLNIIRFAEICLDRDPQQCQPEIDSQIDYK